MVTDGWQTIFAVTNIDIKNAIRHRGDAYIKNHFFYAVSALFLIHLSPPLKNKMLIASILPTDGDSDRCFATFLFFLYIKVISSVIKRRFSTRKPMVFARKTAVFDSKNAVFWILLSHLSLHLSLLLSPTKLFRVKVLSAIVIEVIEELRKFYRKA